MVRKVRLKALVVAAVAAVIILGPSVAAARDGPGRLDAGAIAAPDRYGALAAKEVLQAGGNAVDAAVATAFALAVTYPEAGNLGGGGFMTLFVAGKPYFLDYRETAPGGAKADMYLDASGQPQAEQSLVGERSSGTPGTVAGMAEAHRRFGRLTWSRDLAPAIRLAEAGFVVTPQLIALRQDSRAPFVGITNFDRYFGAMTANRRFRQPELAATLKRIAVLGAKDFYRGKTAELLVAQMGRGRSPGLISRSDLAGYKAVWREPLQARWRSFQVITAPPPSSGGIALLQLLLMKDDRSSLFAGVDLNTPDYMHLVSELEKRVFADRARYLGDPDFIKVPEARLIDPAYLLARSAEVDPKAPSSNVQPGLEKPQTTHFSIIDRDGNAVSNTYTLNGWFGSGVIVEGAGFLLNDEMDDFSVKPNAPNQFGVVGSDANAIAPLKRPLSSMTPTVLTENGKAAMVIGTPGSSRIFTSIFQVLVDVYDYDLPLKTALAQMRFHHQLLPEDVIFSEPFAPFPDALVSGLKARGYTTRQQDFNGDIEAIRVVGRVAEPAADPRARGVAMSLP